MAKTCEVRLHGNRFEVDPALIGREIELVFDPFDLTDIEVRFERRAMGKATRSRSAGAPTPRPGPRPPWRRCRPASTT